MRIERRKLSYNKLRNQVVTTLNSEFLREIGIEPDSHINIIYDGNLVVICSETNMDKDIEARVRVLKDTGSVG